MWLCSKYNKLLAAVSTLKDTVWKALLQRKPACFPGTTWDIFPLPRCGTSMSFFHGAEQRHLPIALLIDALQVAHLRSKNLAEGEAVMQAPGCGGETLLRAFRSWKIRFQRFCIVKSPVQAVQLGPGSLPWLTAATAGASSSAMLCEACKGQMSHAKTVSPKNGIKILFQLLTVNANAW